MAAGDRLRAARAAWERLERSTRRLEDVQRSAEASLAGARKQADAAAGAAARARAEAEALQAAARSVREALRTPFLWGCALILLGGLAGSLAHHLAGRLAAALWRAIAGG